MASNDLIGNLLNTLQIPVVWEFTSNDPPDPVYNLDRRVALMPLLLAKEDPVPYQLYEESHRIRVLFETEKRPNLDNYPYRMIICNDSSEPFLILPNDLLFKKNESSGHATEAIYVPANNSTHIDLTNISIHRNLPICGNYHIGSQLYKKRIIIDPFISSTHKWHGLLSFRDHVLINLELIGRSDLAKNRLEEKLDPLMHFVGDLSFKKNSSEALLTTARNIINDVATKEWVLDEENESYECWITEYSGTHGKAIFSHKKLIWLSVHNNNWDSV